jgi:hypothetical protein
MVVRLVMAHQLRSHEPLIHRGTMASYVHIERISIRITTNLPQPITRGRSLGR